MKHPRYAEISLGAFRSNIRHLKAQHAAPAKLMVAVKSNAYGHGHDVLAPIALAEGADELAVLDIPTGLRLRKVVPDGTMLCWLIAPSSDLAAAIDASLDLGISHLWQLEAIERARTSRTAQVHLKIDTGLHRNGCLWELWPELVAKAARLEQEGRIQVVGVWSHLADTSVEEDKKALERFHLAVDVVRGAGLSPTSLHIAASAAAVDLPEARLDMVRVGLLAYGVSPFSERTAEDFGCAPVMTLKTSVMSALADELIVPMGYAHGLLPIPPNTGYVLAGGKRCSLRAVEAEVTRLQAEADMQVGDEVILFGRPDLGSPRAEEWAAWGNTIGDEVITALPDDLERVYLD